MCSVRTANTLHHLAGDAPLAVQPALVVFAPNAGPAGPAFALSSEIDEPTRSARVRERTIALNRKARYNFTIEETVEAGIVLTGTEIKSVRAGNVSLSEAYARVEGGEAWLIGAHIAPFAQGNRQNHEPKRTRKLLLHRGEIDELQGRTRAKGLTIVPLRLFISERGRAKVELGLARGKQLHDRRRTIAERDARREVERELADRRRGH